MKPNITNEIRILIAKEARRQGKDTALGIPKLGIYEFGKWYLETLPENETLINHNTKISDLEDWMKS